MTPWEDRDAQFAEMLRKEIAEVKARADACNWPKSSTAWHRAFGELSGLHRALTLIDRNPGSCPVPNGERGNG